MKFSVKWTTPQGFWGKTEVRAWDLTEAEIRANELRGKRIPIDAEITDLALVSVK